MPEGWTLRREFSSPFGTIAYDVLGAGDPLLMIHGTPFSSFVWRDFAPVLAERYQVYVYDLVGYGQSAKYEGRDVSLGVQSKVLAALLDFWRLEQPTVIAHDFGGATALRTHILEQRDFSRMILIDPVAVAPWGSPFVQHVRRHFDAFAEVPAYIHDGILNAYIQDAAYHPLPEETLTAYKAPWTGGVGQAAFYRQIAQMDQRYTDEVEPHYGSIRCPVHLFWGENDGWIPIAQGRKLYGMIPGATFQPIPEAGHLVQEDQPATLLEALQSLI
jgi:pimeloyl-ACP methyl ester carboxylesterase